jgi:hypothetical protein
VFLHITLFYQGLSKTTKMSLWRSNGKRPKCRFDEEINIDEAVPANRGPWISVVDPGTFDLPEPRFPVETGPVIFAPNSST